MAFARSITLSIQDASGATVNVAYGTLTGGTWDPAPVPGQSITPGGAPTNFVNGTGDTFSALGGTIVLYPSSGGSITIGWGWASGSGYSSSVTSQSLTGIGVSNQITGTQTNFATLQVVITNAGAFKAAVDAAVGSL
ncbi:hypothetical protein [Methyloraptor flagellatus]|uniref:Uncharacterized protein n=1 Tax=Methyloraptor flagellatus TaxID=3162530 RepID=A0AAU7XDE7_9HYPH